MAVQFPLYDLLRSLNDELERGWGVRLQMRTGVNTGELVVNDEGILVGDTMNTAARLEQSAGAGQVLIGEATWRLVRPWLTTRCPRGSGLSYRLVTRDPNIKR